MDSVDPNVLKKIQDLLRLANSSNVNESAVAYARAQALLTKYRLTLAEVETHKKTNVVKGGPVFQGKRIPSWQEDLLAGIAKLNSCQALIERGRDCSNLKLIGRPEDMEIVTYMYQSISSQVEFLSHAAKQNKMGEGKTFYNNFKMGIVSTVLSKLKEASEEAKKEYQGTTALVFVNQAEKEVTNFCKSLGLKQAPAEKFNYNPDGFSLGQKEGNKVNLAKGIGNSSQKEIK